MYITLIIYYKILYTMNAPCPTSQPNTPDNRPVPRRAGVRIGCAPRFTVSPPVLPLPGGAEAEGPEGGEVVEGEREKPLACLGTVGMHKRSQRLTKHLLTNTFAIAEKEFRNRYIFIL
jgi:hypothetical protein